MKNRFPTFRMFLLATLAMFIIALGFGCRKPVYYSSKRVYEARKEQDKRLKRKGYSNQQYRYSPGKKTRWSKSRRPNRRRYKTGGGVFRGRK